MTTRERVLSALIAADSHGLSGQSLADDLGVSRAAVAKHVAALQADGYSIEAIPGRGYRLLSAPEAATPAGVSPRVESRFWVRITGGLETGSTNDDARSLARAGAAEGTAVVAASQTAGKGRLGRSWSSPHGGAYVSAVLRPSVAPTDVSTLALAIGVAVARAFERFGARPRLKWPNDVLLGEGKVAGILLEMAAEADRVEWIVAGIGVNVRRPAEAIEPVESRAAYLSDEADQPAPTPAAVAAAVLDEIASAYEEWLAGGFRAMVAEYRGRHALLGQTVTVRDATGRECASGTVVDVDEDGRLVVEAGDGTQARVAAGEVTLRG